jgi:hypothetical protein
VAHKRIQVLLVVSEINFGRLTPRVRHREVLFDESW